MPRRVALLWLFVSLTVVAPGAYVLATASTPWSNTEILRLVVGAIGGVLAPYFGYQAAKGLRRRGLGGTESSPSATRVLSRKEASRTQPRQQDGAPEAIAVTLAFPIFVALNRTDWFLIGESDVLEFIVLSVLFLVTFFVVRTLVRVRTRDRS